ncbi:hypothetical protein [Oceanicoccus sp. KOV_DT_Chl]|uniref:hypothetical protein n=1 Tax=Oceanicoccus sp. KOV_DT_Chl TaxID=1904639 RepID=UPI000C7DDE71|nr:hypothetical protein [Oceanicoccus sp. KOV_DT_Chl]
MKLLCRNYRYLLSVLLVVFLQGCSTQGFHIKQLAKSDIDMVTDMVWQENQQVLIRLLQKLYKRNPSELAKNVAMTVKQREQMLFQQSGHLRFAELQFAEEISAMSLAFDSRFEGDRVFALMVGLTGMLRHSYNYNDDFFLTDELDAQVLYNSARNIEVMAWKLKHKKNTAGRAFIISNRRNGVLDNTSFDRLYGKLIQTQDLMAKIIADRDNRTINTVLKSTLSVFLPI